MSDDTARQRQAYVIIDELAFLDWDEIRAQVGAVDFCGELTIHFDLDQGALDRVLEGPPVHYCHEDAGGACEAAAPVGLDAGVAASSAITGAPIDARPFDRWPPIRGPPRPSLER
ncbi:MAG: hypothetical protein WAP03_25515 [Methylorubrum rhodinum]|uniref:hypothetical protein n=1 Tax=Methylorubrum rhodinum TaxID=29428 RepID=UPI003BB1DF8F